MHKITNSLNFTISTDLTSTSLIYVFITSFIFGVVGDFAYTRYISYRNKRHLDGLQEQQALRAAVAETQRQNHCIFITRSVWAPLIAEGNSDQALDFIKDETAVMNTIYYLYAEPPQNRMRPLPDIVPQGEQLEDDDKEIRRHKYLSKVDSNRWNKKESTQRKNRAIRRLYEEALKAKDAPQVDPHSDGGASFSEFAGNIKGFVSTIKLADHDETLKHTERMLVLAWGLYRSRDINDFIRAVVSHMMMYSEHSIIASISALLDTMTDDPDDPNPLEISEDGKVTSVGPQGWTGRDVLDGWDLFKSNPIYAKISFLITAAMASTVCGLKDINWTMGGITLIKLEAQKEQISAVSVIDAVINTFVWMSETGAACLTQGSLSPILYGDQRLKEYHDDCTFVLANADSFLAGNVEKPEEYERTLDKTLKVTSSLAAATTSPATKEFLQRKFVKLTAIKLDVISKGKNTAFRFCPAAACIFGTSGVGKTVIAQLTMRVGLAAMKFSNDEAGIITLCEADKYHSTYTSDVVGVHIDDAANIKSSFAEKAPTQTYITMFNNVASQAVKAELNEKGAVFIQFKLGIVTTNVKDLDARLYSNEPEAVLRRFIHVELTVKPQYRAKGGTSLNTDHPDILDAPDDHIVDVWFFKIEEVVPGAGNVTMTVPIDGEDVFCDKLNLREYLLAMTFLFQKHAKKQNSQVKRNKVLNSTKCCDECSQLPQFCICTDPDAKESYSPHALIDDALSIVEVVGLGRRIWRCVTRPFSFVHHTVAANQLRGLVDEHLTRASPLIFSCVPTAILNSKWYLELIILLQPHTLNVDMLRLQRYIHHCFYLALILCFLFGWHNFPMVFLTYYWAIATTESLMAYEKERYISRLHTHHAVLQEYGRDMRSKYVRVGAAAVTVAAIGFVLRAWWNSKCKSQTTDEHLIAAAYDRGVFDGMNEVDTHGLEADIAAKDSAPGWMGAQMMGMNFNSKTLDTPKGATVDQVINTLGKNMCWGRFQSDSFPKTMGSGVFFPRKSLMVFPKHMLYPENNMNEPMVDMVNVEVVRHDKPGGVFKVLVRTSQCHFIPEKDCAVAFVPNSPDFLTQTKWLPDVQLKGSCIAQLVTVDKDGSKTTSGVAPVFGTVAHRYCSMEGAKYRTDKARPGSCMSVLVVEGKKPCVVGFHIGGDASQDLGISQTITRSEINNAAKWIDENVDFLSAEATIMPHSIMGVPILSSPKVHERAHYINSLGSEAYFDLVGSVSHRAQQTSHVVDSFLKEEAVKIFDIQHRVGPAQMLPNWKVYDTALAKLATPSEHFDPELLEWAANDYLEPLLEAMDEYVKVEDFRPLTVKEAIMGIPGKKFIDPLNMNTGMGFPLGGKKNAESGGEPKHFVDTYEGKILVDRTMLPHVQEEVDRIWDCWEKNERAHVVFEVFMKDTPTPLGSEKVRTIQGSPVAASINIRRLFLPISRFLHLHSCLAETAVGVNPFSMEWETLMQHALAHANSCPAKEPKILLGDYKAYDARMSSQISRKSWGLFVKLALRGGYTLYHIGMMKTAIIDMVHPLFAMNGTLVRLYNSNASGHSMTVDVNGVGGSLYVRMGARSVYPNCPSFRLFAALLTYGDDFLSTIKFEYQGFNFRTFREFLAKHGVVVTLPDKSDRVVDFLPMEEVDFLKRKTNFIPKIGVGIGKLTESSILTPLMANVASSETPRVVAVSCCETALHEWFAYGEEEFEERRAKLKIVCANLGLPVEALKYTFDDRVAFWLETYQKA